MRLDDIPRFPLARTPTPLHEAARLREALGGARSCPRILFKRDDLTDLALGGNKARKLEFLVADAMAQGATTLITSGGLQSNHARMTAAAARLAGLDAVAVLTAPAPVPEPQGNLLLDHLLDAEVRFVHPEDAGDGDVDALEAAAIATAADHVRARGGRPYVIVVGGSDGIGALGYVVATRELLGQLRQASLDVTRLYHASGSRGTRAGLELGARLFDAPYRITGIAVSPGGRSKQERAVRIAADAADRIGVSVRLDVDALDTDEDHFGAGYAIPTAEGVQAIRLVARAEGIFLDPVYTGKAMAGLLAHIRDGRIEPAETIVFLHTGGVPGLFAQATQVLTAD